MDTSKQYIKMCEKATEIQAGWEPLIGDYSWHRYTMFGEEIDSQIWEEDKRVEITIIHTKSEVGDWWVATNENGETRSFNGVDDFHKQTCVFLPRQDQLQEIYKQGKETDLEILADFSYAVLLQKPFVYGEFLSMEQLWLMYVMKEKYGKVWDGEQWIKEGERP